MIEKKEKDLQKLKKEDLKQRRLRLDVRRQLDNAVYAFMYAVESRDLEVEKAAEDLWIDLLFDEDTVKMCEKAIGTKERVSMDLIIFARKIAELASELAHKGEKEAVTKKHLKKAIEVTSKEDAWPFN